MIPSIIINVILLIAIVYLVFVHIGAIKDEDKNFIPDSLEDKVKGKILSKIINMLQLA